MNWKHLNSGPKAVFKIAGMPKDKEYNQMPFGRQIEFRGKIQEFKDTAQSNHFSTKGKSFKAALKEFLNLYKPKEYFCLDTETPTYKDDSVEIWHK
jgi:hypothetical protein